MSGVPLHAVLPEIYAAALPEVVRLVGGLEGDRAFGWHWYPEAAANWLPSGDGILRLLVDGAAVVSGSDVDWLALNLVLASAVAPGLIVNAYVEVACWCPEDHNMHPVREIYHRVDDAAGLLAAVRESTAMLADVLHDGPFEPAPWRVAAGLPDR